MGSIRESNAHVCKSKQVYYSRAGAVRAEGLMREKFRRLGRGDDAGRLQAYQCAACGKWHLGKGKAK